METLNIFNLQMYISAMDVRIPLSTHPPLYIEFVNNISPLSKLHKVFLCSTMSRCKQELLCDATLETLGKY